MFSRRSAGGRATGRRLVPTSTTGPITSDSAAAARATVGSARPVGAPACLAVRACARLVSAVGSAGRRCAGRGRPHRRRQREGLAMGEHRLSLFGAIRCVGKSDLPREALAGVTLAALAIPLNIGYAQVAGLPPIVGLYAAIVPLLVFPLLCTSRHVVASPDAPIAGLIGGVLATMAAPADPRYVQLAYAQT